MEKCSRLESALPNGFYRQALLRESMSSEEGTPSVQEQQWCRIQPGLLGSDTGPDIHAERAYVAILL